MKRVITLSATLLIAIPTAGCVTSEPLPVYHNEKHVQPTFLSRIAVYSTNAAVRERATELVEGRFHVDLVSVPYSHLLIRLASCSHETAIELCVSAQFNGKIIAQQRYKAPVTGAAPGAYSILEDFLLRDTDTQHDFLRFVDAAIKKAAKIDRGC